MTTTTSQMANRNQPIVLITGASRGIGKGLAKEFARRKYTVMLCARNEAHLAQVCEDIRELGGVAEYMLCDVTDAKQVRSAVAYTVATYGRIDIAVLNAARSVRFVFDEMVVEDFELVMTSNLTSVLMFMRELVPVMRAQGGGTIAGVSSLADSRSIPGASAYTASKAALTIILESAAIELKPFGIHVTCVRPGFIRTDMTSQNKLPMPFLMGPDRAARIIVKGILSGKHTVAFPMPMMILSMLMKIVPGPLWRYVFRIKR